jgi:hypothetical protein
MRRFYTVRVDYTVEAESMDEAADKYRNLIDTSYDGIWSIDFAFEEEDDD